MMNFSFLSLNTVNRIARGSASVSLEQKYYHRPNGKSKRYCIRVTYPNGYGASIIKDSNSFGCTEDLWEVAILRDGELCYDTWITGDVLRSCTEEEVIAICDDVLHL